MSPDTALALPPPQRAALDVALLRSADPRAVADQHAVCVAALGIIRTLAAELPLVIAVDDAGWLDRSSDRVLRYVIRRLAAEPVGVLAARRPGSVAPLGLDGPPLDARLHRVALGPLDPDAIHTLLTERCGLQLPRRLTRRIHAACGETRSLQWRSGGRCRPVGSGSSTRTLCRCPVVSCGSPPSASRR